MLVYSSTNITQNHGQSKGLNPTQVPFHTFMWNFHSRNNKFDDESILTYFNLNLLGPSEFVVRVEKLHVVGGSYSYTVII